MITGLSNLFRRHDLVNKFHRVIYIQHGKTVSAICGNASSLQCFQAHPVAWIAFLLSLLRHAVYLIQPQNNRIYILHVPIVAAQFLALCYSQCFKALGRYLFCLRNVIGIGIAEYLLRRKIYKTSASKHGICRQDVDQG